MEFAIVQLMLNIIIIATSSALFGKPGFVGSVMGAACYFVWVRPMIFG